MNRFLDLSETPGKLSLNNGRLRMEGADDRVLDVPIADLAVVVFGHAPAVITLPALGALAAANVAVVTADESGMPNGMLLSLGQHSRVGERFLAQVAASEPRKKAAWASVVRAKIAAQARALELAGKDGRAVRGLASNVQSGDPSNIEAQAAKRYWSTLLGEDFRRDRERPGINQLLNYGYGVLRAIVGRAVVSSGLHPALGLHHHHRANPYPLVDDLMESFRPAIDLVVLRLNREKFAALTLDTSTKRRLLTGVLRPIYCNGESRTLFDAATQMTSSLADYMQDGTRKWSPPAYDPEPLPVHQTSTGESDV